MKPVEARYIYTKCPTVLHIFLQPPTLNCLLLHSTPSSSNVTAGGSQLYVICAKYEIHKKFSKQLQPSMFSRGCRCGTTHAHAVTLSQGMRTHYHFLPSTSPFSTWNALALTRLEKGVAVYTTFQMTLDLRMEMSCV